MKLKLSKVEKYVLAKIVESEEAIGVKSLNKYFFRGNPDYMQQVTGGLVRLEKKN